MDEERLFEEIGFWLEREGAIDINYTYYD
jgi:hypothetical protein